MSPEQIEAAIRARKALVEVAVSLGDNTVDVGGPDGFRLYEDHGQIVVSCREGHAHLDEIADAVTMLENLLSGRARFTQEFRDTTLASTWLETFDGTSYEVSDEARFLSPFDRCEWTTRPGEQWRQVRTTYMIDDASDQIHRVVKERTVDQGSGENAPMLTWLEDGLGPPVKGLRWVVGPDTSFVFQAPANWRADPKDEATEWVRYSPPFEGISLAVGNFFRTEEDSSVPQVESAVPPHQIEKDAEELDEHWTSQRWKAFFSNGTTQMLGMLAIQYLRNKEEDVAPFIQLIDESISESLFVPKDWKMRRASSGP